jgi:hypothetical protein
MYGCRRFKSIAAVAAGPRPPEAGEVARHGRPAFPGQASGKRGDQVPVLPKVTNIG